MAKERKEKRSGYGKILDAWVPPPTAGDPIGCIASTFTFHPEHFEEQCFARFLRLESDPEEDGPLYLVEFEEKASQVACAAVLVDQYHCRAKRSLRWDLLSVNPPAPAIQHAKISLLYWSNLLRVIVGSANLTEDGYRRNREVFAVVDFAEGSDSPRSLLNGTVDSLRTMLAHTSDHDAPPARRCGYLLDRVRKLGLDWAIDDDLSDRSRVHVVPMYTQHGQGNIFQQIERVWPGKSARRRAWVVSPFFDPPAAINNTARALWRSLPTSGNVHVQFCVEADELPGGALRIHAPQSLVSSIPNDHRNAIASIARIKTDDAARPLHMKVIWFESDAWVGYLIGSSNFTSSGMGCKNNPNLEANLLYLAHRRFCKEGVEALDNSFPRIEDVPSDSKISWQVDANIDTPPQDGPVPLPAGFQSVSLAKSPTSDLILRFRFGSNLPPGWWFAVNEQSADATPFYQETEWHQAGSPAEVVMPWTEPTPPYGFTVYWDGRRGGAWWPVNIESSDVLPPPDELRDLPLEALLNILTSARSLRQSMASWLNRQHRGNGGRGEESSQLDPHKRVNTSTFLLQRTRRVSWALSALGERLSRPVATMESLRWRLYGPVGVEALARALLKEAHSNAEQVFLIAELSSELMRVRPQQASGCLRRCVVEKALRELAISLRPRVILGSELPMNLQKYVSVAFEVLRP